MRVPHWAAAAALIGLTFASARAQDDVPLRAMKDELARSMSQLQLERMEKPYFIAYRVDDVDAAVLSAVLGGLVTVRPERARLISVELRVGGYAFDNGNYFSVRNFGGMEFARGGLGPLDDSYQEIRRQLWLATDAQYKKALEDLSAKRAALRSRQRSEEVPDFSREDPDVVTGRFETTGARTTELEALARELSAVFRSMPEIHSSSVKIEIRDVYTRFVNSEGSSFTRSSPSVTVQVDAETRSADGLPVSDSMVVRGRVVAELPPRGVLLARAREMAARILELRSAPSVERYNGPVLFEGTAAAEVFAQQFAGGLVALRQPISDDPRFDLFYTQMTARMGGGSFVDKIGGRVLPEFLSVDDVPLRSDYQGGPLLGGQGVDDDGVRTRETRLVDHGTLKTVLATRVPVRAVQRSTGSRRAGGPAPSNLLVSSEKSVARVELRKELLRRARSRGLDYGIIVRRVGSGDATASLVRMAARMAAQAQVGSNAMAEVYKVYPDGREELLRGMELAELSRAAFKDIVAVGDTSAVFTGEFANGLGGSFLFAGASEANAPIVSCAVPSLLFEEVSLVKSQGPFPSAFVSTSPLAAH
jgi:hypothetical protein